MKKKISIIQILFLLIISASSCNDLLDTKPLDKYDEEIVWNDKGLAQLFIYNSYQGILKEYIRNPLELENFYGAGSDDYSDNFIVEEKVATDVNRNLLTADKDCGWDRFSLIRQANLIIERVAASKGLSEADKTEMIAQGKMLRAMVYYKLTKVFGSYVIVDKVLTTESDFNIPIASPKATYDFIIKDLKDAAAGLNETAPNGHLTKGAALAMLSEVALQAAAYVGSGSEAYYQLVKTSCEELFAMGKYSLDPEYYKLFNDYTYAGGSKELIFAMWRSKDVTQFKYTPTMKLYPNGEKGKIPAAAFPKFKDDFLGWGNRWPSQDLVNEYEVIDEDGVAKKWNETSYFKNFKSGTDYVSGMMYKNRDARFYASIVYDSTKLGNNMMLSRVKGSCHVKETTKGKYTLRTNTGYWLRKAVEDTEFVSGNLYVDYHHVMFRLGRCYLNYAEAMYRLNDMATAVEYINKTRTGHGKLPALAAGLSKDAVWKAYKSERRVELLMEQDRYWSLLRWYKADGQDMIPELNHGNEYYEIAADGKSYKVKPIPVNTNKVNNTRVWDKRKYTLPVPQKYINLSEGVLKQNAGW